MIGRPKKATLLAAYSRTGNVSAACKAADASRDSHYRWLKSDLAYTNEFKDAHEGAIDISPICQFRMMAAVIFVASIVAGSIAAPAVGEASDDIAIVTEGDVPKIKARLLKRELAARPSEAEIREQLGSLRDDGSWPDIDYTDTNRTMWQPTGHMRRILSLARGYRSPLPALHQNPEIKLALLRAYDYWMENDFRCPKNWWPNWVGVPQVLYRVMLLMEDELTLQQKRAGIEILKRARVEEQTGQNLIWVAETAIARGCLTNDDWLVMAGFSRIADEIRITTGEGIQADFSFYQHGAQLYSGGYGRGFSIDCPGFAELASGTKLMPEAKIQILSSYLLDGHQWMVRGPTFDYSACGREITRKGGARAGSLKRACRSMIKLNSPRKDEFKAFLARLEAGASIPPEKQLTGNRDFWRSEFMTHHRPQFYASVRTTSTQVVQTEQINDENLHGQLLSDGLMYLMRDGLEYEDIVAVWDWRRLPGITAEQTGESPGAASVYGKRSFVGGVSDGMYGVAAMDFERASLAAKKSWFFFDREIVCLGTGITCSSDQPVWTSVNQCNADGQVLVAGPAGVRPLDEAAKTTQSASWVYHDGVAYVFPGSAPVRVGNETQTGAWWNINHVYSKKQVQQRVFSLGIDHGVAPEEGSYVYVVAPSVEPDTAAGYAASLPVRVLENSPALQAVMNTSSDVCGIVFWEAGQINLSDDLSVSVDTPCLVLLRNVDSGLMLTVSNPANEPLDLTVRVSVRMTGEGCTWNAAAGWTQVRFSLPGGMYAGQSVRRRLHHPRSLPSPG